MHSNAPLISGTLKYSVYELAHILLSSHSDLIKKTNTKKKQEKIHKTYQYYCKRDITACIHHIQFNVVFHSLSKLSFHGNIQNILFIHVHNFGKRDMKSYINSLSL